MKVLIYFNNDSAKGNELRRSLFTDWRKVGESLTQHSDNSLVSILEGCIMHWIKNLPA